MEVGGKTRGATGGDGRDQAQCSEVPVVPEQFLGSEGLARSIDM